MKCGTEREYAEYNSALHIHLFLAEEDPAKKAEYGEKLLISRIPELEGKNGSEGLRLLERKFGTMSLEEILIAIME